MGQDFNVSSIASSKVGQEYVPPHILEEYEKQMEIIKKILSKSGFPPEEFTAEDIEKVKAAMRKLDELEKEGLEVGMKNDKAVLYLFLKSAQIDPYSNIAIDPSVLGALKSLSIPLGDGREIKIMDILDPKRRSDATQKLGDMLLDFAKDGYDIYTKKLKDLQQQVDISLKAINNLKALLKILNQVDVKKPEDWEMPPTSLDKLPQEIRDKLLAAGVKTDKDLAEWIKVRENTDKFVEWSDTYFKKELGVIPKPEEGTFIKILKTRDDLMKLYDALIAAGDSGEEGSPAHALKAVIDEINQTYPGYPPGEWETIYAARDKDGNILTDKDGNIIYNVNNDEAYSYIQKGITGKAGDAIDSAISANQTLSQKLSDKMKEANLFLQTLYDVISQTMKTWDKLIQSPAQKISR